MSSTDGRLIGALVDAVDAHAAFPIHGDGRQTRSMTFVDDAIDCCSPSRRHRPSVLAPINIGSDEERTVLEIAEASRGLQAHHSALSMWRRARVTRNGAVRISPGRARSDTFPKHRCTRAWRRRLPGFGIAWERTFEARSCWAPFVGRR